MHTDDTHAETGDDEDPEGNAGVRRPRRFVADSDNRNNAAV
jgi:hypothetical protein